MQKFFKTSKGVVINTDAIAAIVPYTTREWIDENKMKGVPYTMDELCSFGFNVVDYSLEWHACTYEEAKKIAEMNMNCFTSPNWSNSGYYRMRKGERHVSDKRYNGMKSANKRANGVDEENDEYYFVPRTLLDKPFVYEIHLSAPCGGINYSHMVFRLTVDDYKRLAEIIIIM